MEGIVLTDGRILVSEIVPVEIDPDVVGVVDCKLINPCIILNNKLVKLLVAYTEQTEFLINSDKIFTMFVPNTELKIDYIKLTGYVEPVAPVEVETDEEIEELYEGEEV
jgi:hypothetical protein